MKHVLNSCIFVISIVGLLIITTAENLNPVFVMTSRIFYTWVITAEFFFYYYWVRELEACIRDIRKALENEPKERE